jgi:hypothetical protein
MNRNMLIVVLAAGAVAVLTIGLVAAPNLQTTPQASDSTRVEAPFTSVDSNEDKTRVRAPFVDIEVPKDKKDPAN